MSDVLGWLDAVAHRVSATFMPTEMDDVAAFLRGDAWVSVEAIPHRPNETTDPTRDAEAADSRTAGLTTAKTTTAMRYPLGATEWGRFIPLGIAGTSLISAATSGSRAVLLHYFEDCGFSRVFTVNLVPSEEQQQQQQQQTSLTSSSDGGTTRKRQRRSSAASPSAHVVEIALEGGDGVSAEAARFACVAAVRSWLEDVEDEEALVDAPDAQTVSVSDAATRRPLKTQLRRVLILVRCCADHRAVVATRGGAAHPMNTATASSSLPSSSASAAARRHRKGGDPLLLLLHDLAALTTLYDARLANTSCCVRPAVLLLPEDENYGGALLKQRLREEVGHRYWVHLFLPADARTRTRRQQQQQQQRVTGVVDSGSWTMTVEGGAASYRSGLPPQLQHRQAGEAPLLRGCRLAALWGVLDAAVLPTSRSAAVQDDRASSSPQPPPSPTNDLHNAQSSAASRTPSADVGFDGATAEQLEEALRRHPACFFARPSNAPLCVFLMEALRRFPIVATPAMLRHWQATWTARHSLSDVLFVFHTAVCPFTQSAANADAPIVEEAEEMRTALCGARTDALQCDAVDLIDALLDAAFTLAEEHDNVVPLSTNDFRVEQATLFLLAYEALVQRREGRLRRIPGVVSVLLRLYERHARETAGAATLTATASSTAPTVSESSTDAQLRYAVRHLLPVTHLNAFYSLVHAHTCATSSSGGGSPPRTDSAKREVTAYPMNSLTLPLRRVSVAPQLQSTILLALLPPEASLLELTAVAERTWGRELPESWQRILAPAASAATHQNDDDGCVGEDESRESGTPSVPLPPQLSADNFYHPSVPHALRVLYLLTAHALHAPTEAAKHVPVVQLQAICQLSDEQLLLVLRELQLAGLVSTNVKTQTARTLLDSV